MSEINAVLSHLRDRRDAEFSVVCWIVAGMVLASWLMVLL
jgi:hypothetical protein